MLTKGTRLETVQVTAPPCKHEPGGGYLIVCPKREGPYTGKNQANPRGVSKGLTWGL